MHEFENISIIVFACLFAYILNCIFSYFERCRVNYSLKLTLKNQNKSEIFKKKYEKVHNKLWNYYYTIAVNNPIGLVQELVNEQMIKMRKENLINETYSKMRV